MRPLIRILRSGKFAIVNITLCLIVCSLVVVRFKQMLSANAKAKAVRFLDVRAESTLHEGKITLVQKEDTAEEVPKEPEILSDEEEYDTNYMPYMFKKNVKPDFIFGAGRRHPVSVAIGIPHVKRPSGDSYLNKTLDSLTKRIFPDDEDDTVIVVFVAERDDNSYVKDQARYLYKRYKREFDSGMLQVVGTPHDFYPDFEKVPANLGDSLQRVKWRSKEVIDAAILMLYCAKMADHYLMLEDDVIAAKGYMREVIEYLNKHYSEDYLMITAAGPRLGSIGKIFRSSDIPVWASSLLSFYNIKPIDWLLDSTKRMLACSGIGPRQCTVEVDRRVPVLHSPLFFHIGYKSSLAGKTYRETRQEEKSFGNIGSKTKHQNPSAVIKSSIKSDHMSRNVEKWYQDSGGLKEDFCLYSSEENDDIEFHFAENQSVKHILLKTGIFGGDFDSRMCEDCASLEVAKNLIEDSSYSTCAMADYSGNLECRFPTPTSLNSFRIVIKKPFEKQVCFSVVYVKTDGVTLKKDETLVV